MRTIKVLTIAGLIAMISGLQTLSAQTGHSRDMNEHEIRDLKPERKHHHPLAGIPDLTDEQKDKIKGLHIDHLKSLLPLENQLDEKRARLKSLTTVDNVNLEKIDGVIDDITSINNKIMKSRVRHGQDIRNILTEEQRIIFDSRAHRAIKEPRRPKR